MNEQQLRLLYGRLDVYQVAKLLADRIWDVVRGWGAYDRDTVGAELQRAADTIPKYISEGVGWGDASTNRKCVKNARSALFEVRHWMGKAGRRDLFSEPEAGELKIMVDILGEKLKLYLEALESMAQRGRR